MSATGAKSFFLAALEEKVAGYNVGAPIPRVAAVAAPAAPVPVSAGVGTVTGTVTYKQVNHVLTPGGSARTAASAASAPITASDEDIDVPLTVCADTTVTCWCRELYRDAGSGYKRVSRTFNNTAAVTVTDGVVVGSEENVAPPAADETAANWGAMQLPFDPSDLISRDEGEITTNEITGDLGHSPAILGEIGITTDHSSSARSGPVALHQSTMFGKPAVVRIADEPVSELTFPLADADTDSISMWGLYHQGQPMRPMGVQNIKTNSLEFKAGRTGELQCVAKGRALADTECGFSTPKLGNTGTNPFGLVVRGTRDDANAFTDEIWIKFVGAASGGQRVVKVATCAPAGTPTYSGPDCIVYYDTVTKKQICGSADIEPWTPLYDQDGASLGLDRWSLLEPFCLHVPGDVTLHAANDEHQITALSTIPGLGSAPYTGQARRIVRMPLFTLANVQILRGLSSADELLKFEALSLKIDRTISAAHSAGATWRRGYDLDVTGYAMLTMQVDNRFDSREMQRILRRNEKLVVQATVTGPLIAHDTATLTAYREVLQWTLPQMAVKDFKAPTTGPGITMGKLTLDAEQPDDGSQVITPFQRLPTWACADYSHL